MCPVLWAGSALSLKLRTAGRGRIYSGGRAVVRCRGKAEVGVGLWVREGKGTWWCDRLVDGHLSDPGLDGTAGGVTGDVS